MFVPGFVDKSQFHACRIMFAFKKHDLPWWRENVEILRYLWKSFWNHRNRLTHVGFHSLSLVLSPELCVSVCVPLWMQYASWHASWSTLFPYCKLPKREHGCASELAAGGPGHVFAIFASALLAAI